MAENRVEVSPHTKIPSDHILFVVQVEILVENLTTRAVSKKKQSKFEELYFENCLKGYDSRRMGTKFNSGTRENTFIFIR